MKGQFVQDVLGALAVVAFEATAVFLVVIGGHKLWTEMSPAAKTPPAHHTAIWHHRCDMPYGNLVYWTDTGQIVVVAHDCGLG